MRELKLLFIEDDDYQRESFLKEAELKGYHVIAAASGSDGIEKFRRDDVDLVLCDLNMPGGGGLRVVRECATVTKIVMLTVSEQERDLLDAVAAGAIGYLVKSTSRDELRAALRRAADGEPVFSKTLAALVLGEFRKMAGLASAGGQSLTDREREVLQLVARGYTYRSVGDELFISPRTVENHVRNILDKLHLSRRAELMRYAIEHGID